VIVAGLDVGKQRIGIAVSDTALGTVHPIDTVVRRSLREDMVILQRELMPRAVEKIIIGLPLNMDGSEGSAARLMRNFAARVESALGVPVELCDERLTTFEARDRLRALPVSRQRHRPAVDAIAAMLILETWLEKNRSSGA